MGLHSTRTTPEIDAYLREIISEGYAKNESEAIKLILLERLLKDKGGKASPFKYKVGPTPRNTKGKKRRGEKIGTPQIIEAAADLPAAPKEITKEEEEGRSSAAAEGERSAEDAAAYRGTLTRAAAAEIKTTSEASAAPKGKDGYFGGSFAKPVYPGTLEEYEKEPRKNEFRPPEA